MSDRKGVFKAWRNGVVTDEELWKVLDTLQNSRRRKLKEAADLIVALRLADETRVRDISRLTRERDAAREEVERLLRKIDEISGHR